MAHQLKPAAGPAVKNEPKDVDPDFFKHFTSIMEAQRKQATTSSLTSSVASANLNRLNNLPANSIQNYLIPSAAVMARQAQDAIDDSSGLSEPPIDEESRKGRFGWETLVKTNFPYVVRRGLDKICAVRIIETKVLVHYLNVLKQEVCACASIRSHYMTEAEARVFNEINTKHCDCAYGSASFTNQDLVVKVSDLIEFYHFLDMCVNKLCNDRSQPGDRCGFVRINGESVVPYTLSASNQFVPLFYFEGETDTLKLKAEKLGGWDLSYLKFCCKVQGIRNELFSSDLCSVISLDDIKSYFPPGTVFEDYWPTKGVDKASLIDPTKSQLKPPYRSGSWTIRPTEPPPPPSQQPAPASLPRAVPNGWNGRTSGQQQLQLPAGAVIQQQLARTNVFPTIAYSNTQSVQNGQTTNYYSQIHTLPTGAAPQPPPLVRTSGSSAMTLTANLRTSASYPGNGTRQTITSVVTPSSRNAGSSLLLNQGGSAAAMFTQIIRQITPQQQQPTLIQQQQNRHRTVQQNFQMQQVQLQRAQVAPPTVQRSTTMAQVIHRQLQQPSNSSQLQISLQNQRQNAALQQQAASKQATSPPPLVPTNGVSRTNSDSGILKLTQIEEVHLSSSGNHPPYRIQKALIENTFAPCINAKPYNNNELLMMMSDLVGTFFPNTELHNCRRLMQEALNIELFSGNKMQMRTLLEAGKINSINEIAPLVQVKDVIKYYRQLHYVLEKNKPPRPS